jgi:hypothetical protein
MALWIFMFYETMKVGQNESIRFTLDFETEFKVLNGG